MIVVDASVAVKWFLGEPGSPAARAVLAANLGRLIGPDQLAVEVCATMVREANRDKRNRTASEMRLAQWQILIEENDIQLYRHSQPLLARAATLALDLGHPLKDCLYLALAEERDCPLVTADVRFATKALATGAPVTVLDA